jgi:site-specific DNA-methyltransferase (adenine-specific)
MGETPKIVAGIREADCLVEMRKMADDSVDVIISDPPYAIGKDFGNDSDKMEMPEYLEWVEELLEEWKRILKPAGTLYIYGFDEILAHISVRIEKHKMDHRWLVWSYTNKNVASVKTWQRSHEGILYCWKEKPIFNLDAAREPYTEGFLKGSAGKTRQATKGRFSSGDKETTYNAHPLGALPRDVINVAALAGGAGKKERWGYCRDCKKCFLPEDFVNHKEHETVRHPTQKPLALTQKLLAAALPEGEAREKSVVLVPFAGSGSECLVAQKMGAIAVGFDLNPEYVKIGQFMLKNADKIDLP